PATGLASTEASDSTAAATSQARRRCLCPTTKSSGCSAHNHAATASAIPSVNGIRPMTTLLRTPAVNSQAAPAAAPGLGATAQATGTNAAVAATADSTPTQAGPGHAASGANSIE